MLSNNSGRMDLKFKIPDGCLLRYYDWLDNNEPLYIVLISIDDGPKRMFFMPDDEDKSVHVSRVFHIKEDAIKFFNLIQGSCLSNETVILWESYLENLVSDYGRVSSPTEYGVKERRVVATIFLDGEFRDMEVFWSGDTNLMV